MIDVNDLHKGVTFEQDGALYKVLDYHHNKPGRGNATIRIKAVNLRNGSNIEKTFQSGERVQDVRLDYHNVQYLYNDGSFYYFMDTETYDQTALSKQSWAIWLVFSPKTWKSNSPIMKVSRLTSSCPRRLT